jgi:hypothetical protein
MKRAALIAITAIVSSCFFTSCNQHAKVKDMTDKPPQFGGYESNMEWGQHLVTIGGCHDCHSPKIMTPHGPEIDSSRLLSGHPADMPDIDVNRKEMEAKGLFLSNDLTSWVGPWGISYTANLTSDASGIGAWQESQFIYAIRNGKLKGLPNGRPLLPPMPWQMIRHMTDDELKAVFAYLQSTVPIKNVVPAPKPPVGK